MKTINLIKLLSIVLVMLTNQLIYAQLPDGFDIKKAYHDAQIKGISATDIEGYVDYLHNDYLSHKMSNNRSANLPVQNLGTIYLGENNPSAYRGSGSGGNTTQNAYCPNAGFELLNFSNWSCGSGVVTAGASGAPSPIYTQTASVPYSPSGNNAPLASQNYHTIMTTPPTNSVYPNCVGYDSLACKVIGTQTVSEIPFVCPNTSGVSMRVNGTGANFRACSASYNMLLNPNNKNFSVSYAVIFYDGQHAPSDQPYFSIKITDQNGNPVPGCSVYTVTCNANLTNTASPLYDPSWANSAVLSTAMYKKWTTAAFDLTNYPAITSINVEIIMSTCAQGGHFAYGYITASCGLGGAVTSFCSGSNTAVLNAPLGYTSYQWIGPSGPVPVVDGGNTGTATITPAVAGQVFTCNVISPNGCSSTFQTTVSITTVSITAVGSTPSCLGNNSGAANITATGSSTGYTYQWFNSSGSNVGNAQTATGLSPGVYSVTVGSALCGSATTTVAVAISPPSYYGLNAPFCGTVGSITKPGGSNYHWYTASPLALIAGNTTSSLTINNPVAGTQYYLLYTTASGCKDSILYTLTQTPGGSIYVSNIKSICSGNSNSYAVINLQTAASPAYSYSVTGPSGYSSILTNTTSIKDSITGLSIGTYSVAVFDGQCLYNTTFTVSPFVYNYTLTPQTSTVCTTGTTSLAVNFCSSASSLCGLSTSTNVNCATPNMITMGNGSILNTTTTYPSIYGNYYRNTRHQILYTASELLAAGISPGKISSIAFYVTTLNGTNSYPDFTIKMKCTAEADMSSLNFDQVGLAQVYYAASANISIGWNTYNFPTAYEWDGVSNILVDVCNSQTPSYTQNSISPCSITPFISVRYFKSDFTIACPITSAFGTSNNRPNAKFQNYGSVNPSAFSYTWTPSTGLSSTTSYSTIANPSVTTIYSVQVNPIGQSNCMQAQTATLVVTTPTTPTITPVSTMCSNASSLTLVGSPTGGTWSLTASTSTIGVFTPSLASIGNNTVTYNYGAVGCMQSTTAIIPIERFVPSTITGSVAPQCITNSIVNLSTALSTSTLGVGVWAGNGITGTTFDPATAGVGTHTLTYSTNSLPTVSLCPSTSTLAVSVSSLTPPVISSAGPYCDNFASQTMTVTPFVATGATWSSITAPTSISTTGLFNPGSATIGNNTIIYSVVNGPCTASTSAVVNIVHFIPANIIGSLGPYCIYNPSVSLQPTAQFVGGVWAGNGVTGSDFTPSLAGAGTHNITYSTDPAPSGLCPDSKTLTILVNAKPQANALSNIIQGCNPLQVNLYSSTVNTGLATWNFGDSSPRDTGLAVSHTYTVPGVYTAVISYTDAIGCVNDSAVATSFTVFANPIASFNPSLVQTTVVDGQIEFTNHSYSPNTNTYLWDIGGLSTSTQTNTSYLFENSGTYVINLTATSADNCVDDTAIVVKVDPDVVLYVPNSFTPHNGDNLNDVFQIFLPPTGVDYSTFNLDIYDRWGTKVYSTNDVTKSWNGSMNNSGPLLKQETYVWKISFSDEKKREYNKMGHVTLLGRQ